MDETNQPRCSYIFDHIHKTGGTTFMLSYLSFGFDEKDRFILPGTDNENQKAIEELCRQKKNYFIIGGHNASKLRETYPSAKYITLMREPVSRIISLYLHVKFHPGACPEGIDLGRFSISQLVKDIFKPPDILLSRVQNFQSRYICYPNSFDGNIDMLTKRYYLIGLTERLPEFIFVLHVLDNFPLVLFNNRMVRKEKENFHVTNEERELIIRYNQEDILLYKAAQQRFDRVVMKIKASGYEERLQKYLHALELFQKETNFDPHKAARYKPGHVK